jgi:NADH dehydrogenase
LISGGDAEIASARADVNDDHSVAAAIADCFAVVNAVSLYVERGTDTFRLVHVDAAARVARLSAAAGLEKLVHISGIGADAGSPSAYIRSRGEGEAAVLQEFPAATLVRPAVMFGPDDTFLVPLLSLLRRLPVFPIFGHGETRLQPAYVEDVGEAVARIVRLPLQSRSTSWPGRGSTIIARCCACSATASAATHCFCRYPFYFGRPSAPSAKCCRLRRSRETKWR